MPSSEHDGIVALIKSEPPRGSSGDPVAEARRGLDSMGALFAVPPSIVVEPFTVSGRDAEWLTPATVAKGRHLLYLHGGAYVAGSLNSHRSLVGRLAVAMQATAVHLDYRLAPEHPAPAALDDAVGLYEHLCSLGVQPEQVIVAGDSAGGGLALALTLRLRELGLAAPSALVLLSPWLDLTMTSPESTELQDSDPMLTAASLLESANLYGGDDLTSHLVSPINGDFTGLCPALVFASSSEILVGDTRTFAKKAAAAGASVTVCEFDGLIHVWPFVDGLPEATAVMEEVTQFVEAHFLAT